MKDSRPSLRGLAAMLALVGLSAVGACAQPNRGGGAAGAGDAPPAGTISAADLDSILPRAQRGRAKGSESAPVTIVEVSDFQCPFCRQFAETTYHQLDSVFIQTGQVRLLYINLPLGNHREAYIAAEAAMCAAAQDRFWPMHDRIFTAQREWTGSRDAARLMDGYAQAVGLDMAAFRDCTQNDRTAALIIGDAMEAAAGGVGGTPAFFLTGPGGRQQIGGAMQWEQLRTAIEAVSAPAQGAEAPPPAQN